MYRVFHMELNKNHKKLFYYTIFKEKALPYFILVKEEKEKKLIERELTHFWQMFPFHIPENTRKPGFLVFSGGMKWEHWPEMG